MSFDIMKRLPMYGVSSGSLLPSWAGDLRDPKIGLESLSVSGIFTIRDSRVQCQESCFLYLNDDHKLFAQERRRQSFCEIRRACKSVASEATPPRIPEEMMSIAYHAYRQDSSRAEE